MVHIKILRHSERYDFTNPIKWIFSFGGYWSDPPLTNKGHRMAYLKGKEIRDEKFYPVNMYCSPYIRTISTGNEIKKSFTGMEIIFEPLIAEYQPYFKHQTILYPIGLPTNYNGESTLFKYPETYDLFQERVTYIIDKIMSSNSQDTLIISHGEFLKAFISYLQNQFPLSINETEYVSYLYEISFDYDYQTQEIDEKSIKLSSYI